MWEDKCGGVLIESGIFNLECGKMVVLSFNPIHSTLELNLVDGWMLFGKMFVQVMKSPTPLMHCAFTAV